MKKQRVLLLMCIGFLMACKPDLDYEVRGYSQKIIVEGKIETGRYPEVYLSLNVPLWKKIDSTTILDHVIRYAKVTVSDGETTEILTSKWVKDRFPPYVYRGTEITGKEGRTYDLTVEYGGYVLYASTTIPMGFEIESIDTSPSSADTQQSLSAVINIDRHKKSSFKIYTKKRKDTRFIETPVLFNESLNLSGLQRFIISPRPIKSDASFAEGGNFVRGDTVDIKICAIDSASTMFFKDLTMISVLDGNTFLSGVKPLNSNISDPGFGIWYGNAVRVEHIILN